MNQRDYRELQEKREHLQVAKAELEALEKQIRSFEAVVDQRLGTLLDQLSDLRAETTILTEKVREIRERRLFGDDLIQYLEGAPKAARAFNLSDLPPMVLSEREASKVGVAAPGPKPWTELPYIKTLYRKLARRYHPDLARNDADRAMCNEQMAEINQAYRDGDLGKLMRIAGIYMPYGVGFLEASTYPDVQAIKHETESEKLERELKVVRLEIARLSRLPIVKLSLDVKLARHERRDLLGEMAYDLQRKVDRKTAERDYLRAQINASGAVQKHTEGENHPK